MKKKAITGLTGAILLTLVSGMSVWAQDFTAEDAEKTALEHAGVNEAEAVVYKSYKDVENGKKVYSVGFLIPGQTKYDYDIDFAAGDVLAREQDAWEPEDDLEYAALLNPETAVQKDAGSAGGALTDTEAADIALKDAGFQAGDVTVTECYKELDDGIEKYNVTFRTADGVEYEYDIDASTGSILSKDMEYGDD